MCDHIRSLIEGTGWSRSDITPIAGDMSARRYARLVLDGKTAILMDSRSDIPSAKAFVCITHWLRDAGLSAPALIVDRSSTGLIILEDLGSCPVSDLIADTAQGEEVFRLCLRLLLKLRKLAPPTGLLRPTAEDLGQWTTLADHHYPGADVGALVEFRLGLVTILREALKSETSVSLRDFHADNLMWLPDRHDTARLGLLDYQDAFLTHPVYDLVSLLTDARTEVPNNLRTSCIAEYCAISGDDPTHLNTAFACFSAQRNLRILGIFARAAETGDTRHLSKQSRVYGYLTEALQHAVFDGLRDKLIGALPAPSGAAT
ncbi:MAG: phosphotransferase [Silicimonas sp.]|nr:phosphotransferase [Silicimonas sp.]